MSKTTHLRIAIANYDWGSSYKCLEELFSSTDFCTSAVIVRQQVESNLAAFLEEVEDRNWVSRLLDLLKNCSDLHIDKLSSFPLYDELPDYANDTYLNSVINLNRAHIKYLQGKQDEAIALLISSLMRFMIFRRYRFWNQQQPQLEAFWFEDPDGAENFLARLSFGKDPIVNAYIQDIWFAICDEIDKVLQ